MRLFCEFFFFQGLLPLSYREGEFRPSSAIRFLEEATGGVLENVKKFHRKTLVLQFFLQ